MTDHTPTAEPQQPLAKVDVLEQLPPEEVAHLASRSTSVLLGAGEVVALDHDLRMLLLLASGRVRVHEPSAAGPDLTISMVEAPTVITQTGFVARPSRAMVVKALEPAVLRILEWEVFEDVVRRNPEVGVKMIHLLSERLSACEMRLSDMIRKEVPARLATLLLDLSEHHGVGTAEDDRLVLRRFTHQELASMVGSNREAVTRAFRKLRDAGAVEIEGRRVYVTDEHVLERLASAER